MDRKKRWDLDAVYCMVRLLQAFMVSGMASLSFYISMGPCVLFNDNVVKETSHYQLGYYILLLAAAPCSMAFGDSRAMIAYSVACTLVSLYNYIGLVHAGTVVVMRDFWNTATLRHILGVFRPSLHWGGALIVFLGVAMIVGSILVDRMLEGRKMPARKAKAVFCTLDAIALAALLAASAGIAGKDVIWSWEEYYYSHGLAVGLAGNMARGNVKAVKPDGYERDAIVLCDPLSDASQAATYPDIVFILDETYYDLGHVTNLQTDVDYMKNYHRLSCFKGYAAVPVVGGGTNASEYELLTGNSMSLLRTYSPYNNIPMSNAWSIAGYLKGLGYSTMAAHPEMSANYHRGMAWKELGFSDMWFADDFKDLAYDGERTRATDHSVFEGFVRFYEEMPEDKPRFAFLITIQNHGSYNHPGEDRVHAEGEGKSSEINEYLTSIQLTDSFLPEITAYFNKSSRPVVVCLVGDHAPAFVTRFHGKGDDSFLKERQTPYLIWSNASDTLSINLKQDIDLCALGAYALYAGGVPLSPCHSNLIRLSQHSQCFTNVSIPEGECFGDALGYLDEKGSLHDPFDGSTAGKLLLNYLYSEYNLLQDRQKIKGLVEPLK